MAQLQMPLSIWLSATPEEQDNFYLQAGFDPNLPVIDDGIDSTTVRLRQNDVQSSNFLMPTSVGGVMEPAMGNLQPGDDLRDVSIERPPDFSGGYQVPGTPLLPVIVTGSALATKVPGLIRPQFIQWIAARTVGTRVAFANLPLWLRTAMAALGFTGATIAIDSTLESFDLPSFGPDFLNPGGNGGVDIQIQPGVSAQVVGSWEANGVRFYRLLDGKIAVQNKRGRWKVWRPKKPIVLYADGASNLKTMLRADRALNKQAKKIAAMLNRRAPRPRKAAAKGPIIIESGPGNVISR
jgi:hypothetical protein